MVGRYSKGSDVDCRRFEWSGWEVLKVFWWGRSGSGVGGWGGAERVGVEGVGGWGGGVVSWLLARCCTH